MKETSIKSLRRGQLFSLPIKHKDGSLHTHLYERGRWCGKLRMQNDVSGQYEIRTDFFEAIDPFTGVKEMIISSHSNIWKV